MSKKSKTPGVCVFCGKSGVTKQHMWPDWLKSIIPRTGSNHSQFLTEINMTTPGTTIIKPELQFKRGPVGTRKIRKMCTDCNSGWMSRLEVAAKPILVELIHGNSFELDKKNQEAICAWAMMTSIVAEYTDIPHQSIPESDHQHLMNKGTPTNDWRIWIGKYNGENWKQRYKHHGMALGESFQVHTTRPRCNTQMSTFVIGELLIHTASSTIPKSKLSLEIDIPDALIQIWPYSLPIQWPPLRILNDASTDYVSDTLYKRIIGMP